MASQFWPSRHAVTPRGVRLTIASSATALAILVVKGASASLAARPPVSPYSAVPMQCIRSNFCSANNARTTSARNGKNGRLAPRSHS